MVKQLGDWTNEGDCLARNGNRCGPGKQKQIRKCTDGSRDKCTEEDKKRSISCNEAGSALPECVG